jgi:hypothetical protein
MVFELLATQGGGPSSSCVDDKNLRFDGHPWCKNNNINTSNLPFGMKCHKVFYVGIFFLCQ